MARWVIYATDPQDTVADWASFEKLLARSNLTISCDPNVGSKSKRAFVMVSDPDNILENARKGYARAMMLSRRVRRLVREWSKRYGNS